MSTHSMPGTRAALRPQPPSADEVKRRVSAHWGARATAFDQGDSCVSRTEDITAAWRRVFTEAFGAAPKDVLDVGSGTGELALVFHSMGHRARGIDLAPEMLAVAREKVARRGIDLRFDLGDAEAPPFPDASFDVVHARHVLQLLPDPHRAVAEWARILRPGGVVFVTSTHDDGAPMTFGERAEQRVGRAALHVLHAIGVDRSPIAPPKTMGEEWERQLPLRRCLDAPALSKLLAGAGLVDATTRDLLALRLRGRDAMPWWRRWANRRKRAYHAAWARKPD